MKVFSLALISLLFFGSCRFLGGEKIRGNGNIVNVQPSVGAFNSIDAGGAVEVRIKQSNENVVRIATDENLVEFLEVRTDGNTLVIQPKDGYNLDPSKSLVIYASAPRFEMLGVSGASRLFSDGTISGEELEMDISGASEVRLDVKVDNLQAGLSGSSTLELTGEANRFSTEGSGASTIKCMNLATKETTLDLSGASNAEVSADKQLNIDASGASDVRYRGNANINQKSSGASNVRKV